jgi:hypothetical protein
MLLLLDMRIDGFTRERMIVSYYRYRVTAQQSTLPAASCGSHICSIDFLGIRCHSEY